MFLPKQEPPKWVHLLGKPSRERELLLDASCGSSKEPHRTRRTFNRVPGALLPRRGRWRVGSRSWAGQLALRLEYILRTQRSHPGQKSSTSSTVHGLSGCWFQRREFFRLSSLERAGRVWACTCHESYSTRKLERVLVYHVGSWVSRGSPRN